MDGHHLPSRADRAAERPPDRDRLTATRDGEEPRLPGRLDPAAMFPAGESDVHSRWVTLSNGLRLRVVESGGTRQPMILLLHGWGASAYMWRGWFAPLVAAGYRAIAIDLPGHGLSDKPAESHAYRIESMAAVVREFLTMEGRADVIAQSMAGTIALEVALSDTSPVRRLALINPACFGEVRYRRLFRLAGVSMFDTLLPRLLARSLVVRTRRKMYGDPSSITPRDDDESWAPSQFPSYTRAMRMLLKEFPWRRASTAAMAARLRALRSPVLVLLGTRDWLVRDAAPYVSEVQGAGAPLDVREIVGGGHAANEERPSEVAAIVLEFLRG